MSSSLRSGTTIPPLLTTTEYCSSYCRTSKQHFQMSSPVQDQPASNVVPRPARSRNGCSSCRLSMSGCTPPLRKWRLIHARRRKVKCNEQKPRCSHCERLNLDCTWNRVLNRRSTSSSVARVGQFDYTHVPPPIEAFGFSQNCRESNYT
jgi:hypothetical protein